MRKREEKEAAEALKREQEIREAKRQQQRLNFLLSQTELYSHFMQNKSTAGPSDALTIGDDDRSDGQEELLTSLEAMHAEEEDPEEAELKLEALKAAQDAVSKQKKITSAFDSECLKLMQVNETEAPEQDASISGSSNIDLLHPYVSMLPPLSFPLLSFTKTAKVLGSAFSSFSVCVVVILYSPWFQLNHACSIISADTRVV